MTLAQHQHSKAGFHHDQHGSFEVFWSDKTPRDVPDDGPGWYWWSCSPGYLPDGDAQGPYASSYEAWVDARAGLE